MIGAPQFLQQISEHSRTFLAFRGARTVSSRVVEPRTGRGERGAGSFKQYRVQYMRIHAQGRTTLFGADDMDIFVPVSKGSDFGLLAVSVLK